MTLTLTNNNNHIIRIKRFSLSRNSEVTVNKVINDIFFLSFISRNFQLIGFQHEKLVKQYASFSERSALAVQPRQNTTRAAIKQSSVGGVPSAESSSAACCQVQAINGIDEDFIRVQVAIKRPTNVIPNDSRNGTFGTSCDCQCSRLNRSHYDTTKYLLQACDQINCEHTHKLEKGQTLLTSYFSALKNLSTTTTLNAQQALLSDNVNKSERKTRLKWRSIILRKYSKQNQRKKATIYALQRKLRKIVKRFKAKEAKHWRPYNYSTDLLFVYLCINTYHTYTRLLLRTFEPSEGDTVKSTNEKQLLHTVLAKKYIQSAITTSRDTASISKTAINQLNSFRMNTVNATNVPNGSDTAARRLSKTSKTIDNSRLMLLPESQHESTEKDCSECRGLVISELSLVTHEFVVF